MVLARNARVRGRANQHGRLDVKSDGSAEDLFRPFVQEHFGGASCRPRLGKVTECPGKGRDPSGAALLGGTYRAVCSPSRVVGLPRGVGPEELRNERSGRSGWLEPREENRQFAPVGAHPEIPRFAASLLLGRPSWAARTVQCAAPAEWSACLVVWAQRSCGMSGAGAAGGWSPVKAPGAADAAGRGLPSHLMSEKSRQAQLEGEPVQDRKRAVCTGWCAPGDP
ncbi:hypothetical protein NDU88_002659 [Pleurodeles waltl]|uniref:Uncharacterized protein n=1 Tax=Pleurodeles waltl TaxID=8319 RepID=A0AAV7M293_PLEWA|nr:hypothetical protein NDU88_002659 [Pleurodeles waltl]